MKKIILAAISISLVAGGLVATPAHASAEFAGAASCTAALPSWPSTTPRPGTCGGSIVGAVGVGLDNTTPVACVPVVAPCTFNAAYTYTEPCPVPDLPLVPPLAGRASGTFTVSQASSPTGPHTATFKFSWVRVGLTAVLVPVLDGSESAGVAAFVPHPPLGTCQAPVGLTADVVGVAVGADAL